MSPHPDVPRLELAANYPLNCWYVAASSDQVGRGLLPRIVLGQAVVLYRLRSGQVAALEDRCPHRSLPLSEGTLAEDEVVCGYHGMAFGADGRCLRVPSQENVPYGARARSFPVRDQPPFVWIWLGHPATATLSDPPALPWLADPGWATFGETMQVDANYLLLHENALDLTHFPHVHPGYSPAPYLAVPPPLEIAVSETSVSYHRDFPPSRLVDWQAQTTGLPQDRDYPQRESGEFVSPGLHVDRMHILADGDGGSYDKVLTRAFTPVNARSTIVFWQVSRNYLTGQRQISERLQAVHRATLLADKRLLEAIQARADAFPAGEEFNVSADVAALRAQRIIDDMLAAERGWRPAGPGASRSLTVSRHRRTAATPPRQLTTPSRQSGEHMRTRVGIIGAGPAGLMLSHLLHLRGVESVVIDLRTRADIEETIKAGVLEHGTADLMAQTGVGDRMRRDGFVHHGINLAFSGAIHRVDLYELSGGRTVTVYPQHEVLKDLIARRLADGGDIRFGVSDTTVDGLDGDRPTISFLAGGQRQQLECDFVAGCDGSQTCTRFLIPEGSIRTDFFRQYPFAWFGILAAAPPSSDELIYAHSDRGFALISTRSPSVQRLYFQTDPATDPADWSDDRIWAEIQARVGTAGAAVRTGKIFQKGVLQFRSFVCEPMQYGRLFLAGDAAHTVPPTGAKGLNLAVADVHALDRALGAYYEARDTGLLEAYTQTVLRRVWRAQHFSWWMTSMMHRFSEATDFDLRRQIAELEMVTSSPSGGRLLAENYTGLPLS